MVKDSFDIWDAVAYVPQESLLFGGTVKNTVFYLYARGKSFMERMKNWCLAILKT